MRLNSICTILLLTFYLIVPTNGILHLLFHALSQSVPHGLTPDQLFNKLSSSEGIQNAIRNKFNVQQLSNTLQNESQKLGINLPKNGDFATTLEATLQKFKSENPNFNFEQLQNFDFTSFMKVSQFTNPYINEVPLDYSKPLYYWTYSEVLTWWKIRLPDECLAALQKYKANGQDVENHINRDYIEKTFGIENEHIQDKILREIDILKNYVNYNLQQRKLFEEHQKKIENEKHTNMDHYDLEIIKRSFEDLYDHTQGTIKIISDSLKEMGNRTMMSVSLPAKIATQLEEFVDIIKETGSKVDILENALENAFKEISKKDEEIESLQNQIENQKKHHEEELKNLHQIQQDNEFLVENLKQNITNHVFDESRIQNDKSYDEIPFNLDSPQKKSVKDLPIKFLKQGWLRKQGDQQKWLNKVNPDTWETRWMVLDTNCNLSYFETTDIISTKPEGQANFLDVSVLRDNVNSNEFSVNTPVRKRNFKNIPARKWNFKADDADTAKEWIDVLTSFCEKKKNEEPNVLSSVDGSVNRLQTAEELVK